MNDIIQYFESSQFDDSWSFEGCTPKDTNYVTHGYHRYPAKFIPQLAARLVKELSAPGDLIVDPFMGSGTALVEAKILGRPSVGVDINPVAHLISKAKVTPIEPSAAQAAWETLALRINGAMAHRTKPRAPDHARIDYWFTPETKRALGAIHSAIQELPDEHLRDFFLCGFSHILKNCSIWLMKSIKPTRDRSKTIPDPHLVFTRHVRQMLKRNADFWNLLQTNGTSDCSASPHRGDSRQVPVRDDSVALVVTSPPYVTSYEYADLHQLTALWLGYADDLGEFRKPFIGSAQNDKEQVAIGSELGEKIVDELERNKTGKSKEVAVYFSEMRESFMEMHRHLRHGGKACTVIGDTAFKRVPVPNAEVFVEQMLGIGFRVHRIIKRRIPSKILPQTRDPRTGKFTSSSNNAKTLAYPYEYIVIMEKV
jgi:DNA modification methylase